MPRVTAKPPLRRRQSRPLKQWLADLNALVQGIRGWAQHQGWEVRINQKRITESSLGSYSAPVATIQLPTGRVHFNPVASDLLGVATGRVEIYATPSFAEAVLLRIDGKWRFFSPDLIDLKMPWNEKSFVELLGNLVES